MRARLDSAEATTRGSRAVGLVIAVPTRVRVVAVARRVSDT
jgi:hypothetical protein